MENIIELSLSEVGEKQKLLFLFRGAHGEFKPLKELLLGNGMLLEKHIQA